MNEMKISSKRVWIEFPSTLEMVMLKDLKDVLLY